MRRLSDLGSNVMAMPDYAGRLVAKGQNLEAKRELTRTAMEVISTFSAVEHIENLLVVRLAVGDPTAVFTLFSAIRADGPKIAAIDAMVEKYLLDAGDRARLASLWSRTKRARCRRNLIAHSIWYSVLNRPEYLVLVDPRLLAETEVAQRAFVEAALARGETGLIGPLPTGSAMRHAKLVEKKDLDDWVAKNFALHQDWGLLLMIVEGKAPGDVLEKIRAALDVRLGKRAVSS